MKRGYKTGERQVHFGNPKGRYPGLFQACYVNFRNRLTIAPTGWFASQFRQLHGFPTGLQQQPVVAFSQPLCFHLEQLTIFWQ